MEMLGYHEGLCDDTMGGISCWLKVGCWITDKHSLRAWILDGSMLIRTLNSWIKTSLWTVDLLRSFRMAGDFLSCSTRLCYLLRVGRGGLRKMIWLVRTLNSWIETSLWIVDLLRRFWMVGDFSSCSTRLCCLSRVARGGLRPMIWFYLDVTSQSRALILIGLIWLIFSICSTMLLLMLEDIFSIRIWEWEVVWIWWVWLVCTSWS